MSDEHVCRLVAVERDSSGYDRLVEAMKAEEALWNVPCRHCGIEWRFHSAGLDHWCPAHAGEMDWLYTTHFEPAEIGDTP